MISAPREEASGRILIEWLLTKERTLNKRYNSDEDFVLRVIYPGIGGYYTPCAFPVADSPPVINHANHAELPEKQPGFSIGDRVNIDATIKKEEWESKQKEVGGYAHSMKKVIFYDHIYQLLPLNVFISYSLLELWVLFIRSVDLQFTSGLKLIRKSSAFA